MSAAGAVGGRGGAGGGGATVGRQQLEGSLAARGLYGPTMCRGGIEE